MKGIYLTIFGICMLLYTIIDVKLKLAIFMPLITTIIISFLCIIVGIIYRKDKIKLSDIFQELY